MNKGTILLYGHTHNSAEDVYFQKCLTGMEANNCRHVGDKPIQAYNVGCMKPWIDYEPRSLKEIAENYQNIKKGFRWKPLFLCRQVLACSIK